MSIVSEINRINTNIANAYSKCNEKGATMPLVQNSSNLASTIDSISSGGGSGDLDWSAIGYSETPQGLVDSYNYAKQIYDNWENVSNLDNKFVNDKNLLIMPLVDTSNATTMYSMFSGSIVNIIPLLNTSNVTSMYQTFGQCYNLIKIPLLDTKNVTSFDYMFQQCSILTTIPVFDTTSATSMRNMFNSCGLLTDESLDNILQMCINATSYTGTKTLVRLGIGNAYYPATRIQALPHYQDFIDAGWTIGY